MQNKLPISVVIPTMNRPETLKRTIDCLMRENYIPGQIIVVDQSQTEEDQQLNLFSLKNYDVLIDIKYIYQKEPSSTVARNAGFNCCENDIVIYSDDDVDVNKDTLCNIYNLMQDKSIAMIAGIDENSGHSKSNLGYFFDTKSYINRRIGHVTLSMLGRYPDTIVGEIETQWAMGYFFVIRKSLACEWNLKWDENLTGYAYAEDLDYSFSYYKHAKTKGLKCILSNKVKVRHLVSKEYRINDIKGMYMFVINREYLSYKHYNGVRSRIATRWVNLGHILMYLARGENPKNLIKAQYRCDVNRNNIKKGIMRESFYK